MMFNLLRSKFALSRGRRLVVLISALVALLCPSSALAIDGSALQKGATGFWLLVMPSDLTRARHARGDHPSRPGRPEGSMNSWSGIEDRLSQRATRTCRRASLRTGWSTCASAG